eukprot:scaffold2119_cov355-Prasinococcus_capsulatus_cf.AAC.20
MAWMSCSRPGSSLSIRVFCLSRGCRKSSALKLGKRILRRTRSEKLSLPPELLGGKCKEPCTRSLELVHGKERWRRLRRAQQAPRAVRARGASKAALAGASRGGWAVRVVIVRKRDARLTRSSARPPSAAPKPAGASQPSRPPKPRLARPRRRARRQVRARAAGRRRPRPHEAESDAAAVGWLDAQLVGAPHPPPPRAARRGLAARCRRGRGGGWPGAGEKI